MMTPELCIELINNDQSAYKNGRYIDCNAGFIPDNFTISKIKMKILFIMILKK